MKTGWPNADERKLLDYFAVFNKQRFVSLNSDNLDSVAELEARGYVCESHGTVGSIRTGQKWDVSLYELSSEGFKVSRELSRNNWPYIACQHLKDTFKRAS